MIGPFRNCNSFESIRINRVFPTFMVIWLSNNNLFMLSLSLAILGWLTGDHAQATLVSNVSIATHLLVQHSIKLKFGVKLRNCR